MISELSIELNKLIKGLSDVGDKYFDVIDLDDMKARLDTNKGVGVGIAYGGTLPTPNDTGMAKSKSSSVRMIDIRFHVIVSYWYSTEDSEDTKVKAFGLLDEIREKVLGQRSAVTNRPWEFISETPLENDGEDATIYYMQTWKVRSSQSSL